MSRKTLLASTLALLLVGTSALVTAQDAAPATPATPQAAAKPAPPAGAKPARMLRIERHERGPDNGGPGFGDRGFGPESPVISDLHALERLYMTQGRIKELPALYNAVLAKSQDPRVRTYVYHQLARTQMVPANADQAIATLRKSLDENLANEAKRREDMDKMRAAWEQHRADKTPQPPAQ
ncbi:hypothetical protein SAMN05216570_2119 [Dyella sp. OK004]|uniref:hypothetical protein n=1 Tax=Dyella sp. OK004 TaxID=1855292 RepID=UPI0008F1B233|nr:hypothetical protein [Dyella sp. OK004]SFS06267.1 hypothetical protein SAMN05216570_2119 [Dyella sp. OK004]